MPTKKKPQMQQCCCDQEFAQDHMMFDDKTMISDVLGSQKSLVKLYSTALCESSCDKLRKLVSDNMDGAACDQFDSFNYMSERNMYPTDTAQTSKVTQAKNKFKKMEQQLS